MENQEDVDQEYPIRWNMLISTGRKFHKENKKVEAMAIAELTEELYPDFVYAIEGAADIYKYCGEKEMARATYQKALEIYPCYNIIERKIKEQDEPVAFGQKYKRKEPDFLAAMVPCKHHNH
ncbi:MAG: hypothetical protein KF845_08475 [Cyclobacteriaceae bacterium]|nr:hypothetical protein [Cyclobacteriaceae bacterium]